jgi:hypothetical protein
MTAVADPTTTDWIQAVCAGITAAVTIAVLIANARMTTAARRQADAAVDGLLHAQRPRLEAGAAPQVAASDVVFAATNVADGQAVVQSASLRAGATRVPGTAEPRVVPRGAELRVRFHVRPDAPEYADLSKRLVQGGRGAVVDLETENLSGSERQIWSFPLVAPEMDAKPWVVGLPSVQRRYLPSKSAD